MTYNIRTPLMFAFVGMLILGNSFTDASRILMITFQQPSHVIMKLGIAVNLIQRGHEVHFLLAANNPIADTMRQAGIRVIGYQPASGVIYPFTAEYEEVITEMIFNRTREQRFVSVILHKECEAIMSDHQLTDHLKSLKIDMLLVEPFIINPCYLLIPRELGVPYILATAFALPLQWRIPALPSFVGMISIGGDLVEYPLLRTVSERFSNAASMGLLHNYVVPDLWADKSLIRKYAPEIESWDDLMLKAEMILYEKDHLLDVAFPLLPHVVTIAGCTIRPPQPLPDSLEAIMIQSGEDGVILVSFGTAAHRMSLTVVSKFFSAFGRLRETVITKMAAAEGTKVPDNVHLVKWLPQNDILGHPKTKLFITHCGSNGQYEALYYGVPMLGIPMFAEQGWNCARAKHRGIALCLDLLQFTADELHDSIVELIQNTSYRNNIHRLSQIKRDEPMDGCETAGHWISHVIKYGSQHLRSPALELSMYQFLMLDLIGIALLLISILVTILLIVSVKIVGKVRSPSQKQKII